jgi:transposase InsO family protein
VVDWLTKYAHFLALKYPYIAEKLAQVFMNQLFKLHGMPQTIISDRDATFTSKFWTEVFKFQRVFLSFSTTYHPQSNGQLEAVNKFVENYLRCMVRDKLEEWVSWLHLAEYCYNTAFHHSTKLTPFEAMYGYFPPRLLTYMSGTTKLVAVENQLQSRDQLL